MNVVEDYISVNKFVLILKALIDAHAEMDTGKLPTDVEVHTASARWTEHQNYQCMHVVLDINECNERLDQCNHICTNTEGSYRCSCYTGYRLLNSHTCRGKLV